MTVEFADNPPPVEQRIRELHAWVATNANDSEGIISVSLGAPGDMEHMPLVNSNRSLLEKMQVVAERAIAMGMGSRGSPAVGARIVSFRRIERGEQDVATALRLLLDHMDYQRQACGPTEAVAAAVPTRVLEICRLALLMRDMPPGSEPTA